MSSLAERRPARPAAGEQADRAVSGMSRDRRPTPARDVVFTFSYLHWDGAQQRGMNFAQDRLAQTLLHDERVGKVLIANWFRSVPKYAARKLFPREGAHFPKTPRARLHQPVRLGQRDPLSVAAIERTYRGYDRSLQRAARRMGLQRPAVITMHPLVAGFAPLEWAGEVTFYASDDWTGAAHIYGQYVSLYEEAFRRVRDSGRRLCAVSQPIVDRLGPIGPAVVVPNGIDPAQWTHIGPPPAWFDALPRPRVLYVGTLDRRIDVNLVAQVAAGLPEASVVLVGRLSDPAHFAALRARGNVHLQAPVAHAQVPALIRATDACMIPHADTQLTRSMSPLKLYEYLAAGRPVVSVDLPPIRALGRRVVLAAAGDDFGERARVALARGATTEQEREQFLAANSWRTRHETILDFALDVGAS